MTTLTAVELFCGIGGFAAAALGTTVRVVAACDHDQDAVTTYALNFPGSAARKCDLEQIGRLGIAELEADLWWLSPPCQPYCIRGTRRDLDDPRARSLGAIIELLQGMPHRLLPRHILLENVTGFMESRARERLLHLLESRRFHLQERHLCPTELGVPSRRPRYYLCASRDRLLPPGLPAVAPFLPLHGYLDDCSGTGASVNLLVPDRIVGRFSPGLRILDPHGSNAYTTCFTAGYGRSVIRAGSYLRWQGGVRYFSPEEIARLLHFPPWFRFPETMSLRKRWHLVGNSLSVAAVREVLRSIPGISLPR